MAYLRIMASTTGRLRLVEFLALLPPRVSVHLGFRALRCPEIPTGEVKRMEVHQQWRVAVLVSRTEEVVVLA